AFRIPLIPADQDTDIARVHGEIAEAEIAWSEIKLLVVERIVRDMHLAISPGERSIVFDHGGGVVIDARRAPLKQGSDNRDMLLLRNARYLLRRRSGNWLSEIEECMVFALAKILGAKKLGQADNIGAGARSFANPVSRLIEIGVGVRGAGHLHQSDAKIVLTVRHGKAFLPRDAKDPPRRRVLLNKIPMRRSGLFENQNRRGYGGGPQATLVAHSRLRDVGGANNFVGDAIRLFFLVTA